MRRLKITMVLGTMIVLLAGVAVALVFWLRAGSSAQPPTSRPPRLLHTLSNVVNNLNADTRSCEIASWFVDKLVAQAVQMDALTCESAHLSFDLEGIVQRIPGANEVTKRATVKALADLVMAAVEQSCNAYGAVSGEKLAESLRGAKQFCLAPAGTLLSLYPAKSSVALP